VKEAGSAAGPGGVANVEVGFELSFVARSTDITQVSAVDAEVVNGAVTVSVEEVVDGDGVTEVVCMFCFCSAKFS